MNFKRGNKYRWDYPFYFLFWAGLEFFNAFRHPYSLWFDGFFGWPTWLWILAGIYFLYWAWRFRVDTK